MPAKRFQFAPCCRAAIGTIWWMKANLDSWPPPGCAGEPAALVGPSRDGWASNAEITYVHGERSRPRYRSVDVDVCPHCGTDLRTVSPSGPGITSTELNNLILANVQTLTGK